VKVELDLPEWTNERHLYLMAGIELVAYKHHGEDWKMKVSRCSMCGKCCEQTNHGEGCEHLKDNMCSLGVKRPWVCCISHEITTPGCTEKFD